MKKMQQLKFNCKENLKSLLNRSKTSTIRKAYEDEETEIPREFWDSNYKPEYVHLSKPCKYEVGKPYEAVWTGEVLELYPYAKYCPIHGGDMIEKGCECNRKLGKVKITSIEKIWIWNNEIRLSSGIIIEKGSFASEELAKQEGFDSVESFFSYMESYAPEIIERSMPFYLIEWVWL